MSTPKVRHDWYQTDEKVVITVLIKNANQYDVQIEPKHVHMTADDYVLDLNLFAQINKERSTYRIVPVKVEITLYKEVGERWPTLEAPENPVDLVPAKVVKIYKQDWDSMEKQIVKDEEENGEGDALNHLFQKIYKNASEETRRAMNKSFSESGGTVLSTNWDEIGQKQVEVKPPDGTEFKKWD